MEQENRIGRQLTPVWLALYALLLTSCGSESLAQTVNPAPSAGQPTSTEPLRFQNCTLIYIEPAEIDRAEPHFVILRPGQTPNAFCAQVNDPRQLQMPTTLVGIYTQQTPDGHYFLALGEPPVETLVEPSLEAYQELYPGDTVRLFKPLPDTGHTVVVDIRFGFGNGQEVTFAAVGTVMPATSLNKR